MKPVDRSGWSSEHVALHRYTLMSVLPAPSQPHENDDVEEYVVEATQPGVDEVNCSVVRGDAHVGSKRATASVFEPGEEEVLLPDVTAWYCASAL